MGWLNVVQGKCEIIWKMNKGKLSIFHSNVVVTKQSQLYFMLYISHILHSGSVTVISLHQNVKRKKKRKGLPFWQAWFTPINILLFQKQCTCQIARFGEDYPLFIALWWRDSNWRWCQERCLRSRSRFRFQLALSLDAAMCWKHGLNLIKLWETPGFQWSWAVWYSQNKQTSKQICFHTNAASNRN